MTREAGRGNRPRKSAPAVQTSSARVTARHPRTCVFPGVVIQCLESITAPSAENRPRGRLIRETTSENVLERLAVSLGSHAHPRHILLALAKGRAPRAPPSPRPSLLRCLRSRRAMPDDVDQGLSEVALERSLKSSGVGAKAATGYGVPVIDLRHPDGDAAVTAALWDAATSVGFFTVVAVVLSLPPDRVSILVILVFI